MLQYDNIRMINKSVSRWPFYKGFQLRINLDKDLTGESKDLIDKDIRRIILTIKFHCYITLSFNFYNNSKLVNTIEYKDIDSFKENLSKSNSFEVVSKKGY